MKCPYCGASLCSSGFGICVHCNRYIHPEWYGHPLSWAGKTKEEMERPEKEYWDNKRAGMRSIASDIVARALSNKPG